MPTTVSARFVRTVRWLAVTCTLVALGHVAAQCVDVPALGSDRSVEVGDVTCVASRLASDARHTVAFDLRVATPGHVHDLVLHAPGATALEVCVQVAGEWSCRGADADGVRFVDLLPPEGTVGVRASLRGDVGQSFRVEFEDRGAPQPGFAYEPNDHIATATLIGDDLTIRGRFQGRNVDVLRVEIEGDPQLWRVQVLGPTVDQLNLLAASGRAQQTRTPETGDRGVRMSNLYLLPGPHYLSVRGTDGDYALRLIPLGPADEPPAEAVPADPDASAPRSLGTPTTPRESAAAVAVETPLPTGPRPAGQMEREPNDEFRTASLLRPGEPWVGLLSDPRDVDVYRFYLGEDGPVRLTATPPEGMALYVRIDGGGRIDLEPGETFVLERWFLAGDHSIALSAATPVDGYYQVLLERLDPFQLGDFPQPHGGVWWRSRPLPEYHEIRAVLERTAYVRLPELTAPTTLTIEVLEGAPRVNPFAAYSAYGSNVTNFRGRRDDGIYVAELPAGGPYLVRLDGGGHAHLRFTFDDAGPVAQPRPDVPPVTLSLHGARDVAAYHPYAQRLELELEIRNDGDRPLDLALDTHVSDHGWRLTPREATITVPSGETRRVAIDATIDPIARDDLPVDLTVAVRAADGGAASVATSATAVCGAPLIGGQHAFAVPEPLLGGINVAWTNLGADVPSGTRREFLLFDGLTPPAGGWLGGVDEHTTVRLAGDGTPRVVGVLLHPLSSPGVLARLRDFEIQTSLDGTTFTTVHRGRMRTPNIEQAFVFDEGVAARYVRLVALSNHDGDPRANTGLGQFKVVAEPGARVLGDRVDLGWRAHGGHVAAALPFIASYELSALSPRSSPTTFRLDHGQDAVWWVHAFHHNRAALLDGLTWHAHPGASAQGEHMADVTVSVSLDSPLGPWTEVGSWRTIEQAEWRFDAPVWARFVRIEAHFPEADRPTVVLPDRIGLLEHPEGPEYRSVLGEWGHYARDGALEWRHPPSVAAIASGGEHATRDRAARLSDGETFGTHVLVGEYDAWFAFDVPAASNFVRLELLGDPTVDYLYEFTDADGEPVVADVRVAPERIEIEAFLEPGRYFVHAWEPLRNVVFSWDDSGSMGPYIDATMQTVFAFARDVDPAREVVQLQVFARDPYFLLDEWSGEPIEVLRSVLDYPRDEGSSDAEGNLAFAVAQLAAREGTRAVFLVTDAESSPGERNVTPLWEAFLEAPAKVFAFETSSGASDDTQDRMQTYADVAGGFYDYSRTLGDLDVAFARASCLLRQPKAVRVALRLETRDPPGPGALVVRRPALDPAEQEAARPAVHVIYDASGSMGQLIPDGSASRVAVARQVLTRLVDDVIEPGTPFALRAYGHVSPMTCDTALVHPLAPLDRSAARAAIASVEPKLLSGTPLAASIEAVSSDLSAATGPKTVILLTDGEETCGGDPEAAIRALVALGIDVQLSIIGFDVDTDDAATMRSNFAAWAELGGGIFLEAFDAGELREALEAALYAEVEVRFEVLGGDGSVVAIGVVDGDAVPLPAGRYALRVIGTDTLVIDDVVVRHEATTNLVLDDE